MKYLPNIAGVLLGLAFLLAGSTFFFMEIPPAKVPGSAEDLFMRAMGPTGYMAFVKVMEVLGGLLVLIPKTRNWGLLILCPILVNIVAYHLFVMTDKSGLVHPMTLTVLALALYLLWCGRRAFLGLLRPSSTLPS